MKTKFAIVALVSAFSLQPSALHAQGSLTPPGAPAPTMKTLAQIEPRTAITNASSAVTISVPGSYYLTTNLTVTSGNAIVISASGVTLEFNSFTISSTVASAAGTGIVLSGGLRNIAILNGFIQGGVTNNGSGIYSGSGFGYGISYSSGQPANVRVSGVGISKCLNSAIYLGLGDSTVVESCTVRTVGSYGIYASTIKNSSVLDAGLIAIYGDQVSDCRGESSDTGVSAVTANNCYGKAVASYGIHAQTAQNCVGLSTDGTGLYADQAALNCFGSTTNGAYGFFTINAENCNGYNYGSGYGIHGGNALNCQGSSASGHGLYADYTALNCRGDSAGGGDGVHTDTAQNCRGTSSSGYGLYAAFTAQNCYGYSHNANSIGLYSKIANTCVGRNIAAGTAIQADIGIGCFRAGDSYTGIINITNRFNMP